MALTTVSTSAASGSVATSPPSTRGNYRRFQVRTRGAAGASYYSGWKISTNSVRRNTAPSPASTAVASPAAYSDEIITLTWSGASSGTSPIKGYQIANGAAKSGRDATALRFDPAAVGFHLISALSLFAGALFNTQIYDRRCF